MLFNRLFRTKARVSRVDFCRYKTRWNLVPGKGVEIQLHHIARGKNTAIILPFDLLKGLPEFQDENKRFSNELLSECNILLEIQKTSAYDRRKAYIEKKKKGLAGTGEDLEKKKKQWEKTKNILMKKRKKRLEMRNKLLSKKGPMLKRR
ncbi:hypothetical protein KY358_01930 [Candidatus Woesearchaeota archaeon]|nr:hypothetical protein [Candidatus Woesearchaeota archaeon]